MSHQGHEGTLHKVNYVPQLEVNILSLDVLDNLGYEEHTKGAFKLINKGPFTVLVAEKCDGTFFYFTLHPRLGSLNAVANMDEWPQRLMHLSPEKIKEMVKNKVVDNLNVGSPSDMVCISCLTGNMCATAHPSRDYSYWHNKHMILHFDTCGKF